MKFARQKNGSWCDPREAGALGDLDNQYHPDWVAARKASGTWFQAVSDTIWDQLMPPPPVAQPVPALLLASGFQDVCETGLGSPVRFGAVIRAMETSADDLVFSLYQRFIKSVTFDKTKSAQFLSVLVNKGIVTGSERTAILSAWPQD